MCFAYLPPNWINFSSSFCGNNDPFPQPYIEEDLHIFLSLWSMVQESSGKCHTAFDQVSSEPYWISFSISMNAALSLRCKWRKQGENGINLTHRPSSLRQIPCRRVQNRSSYPVQQGLHFPVHLVLSSSFGASFYSDFLCSSMRKITSHWAEFLMRYPYTVWFSLIKSSISLYG